MEPSERRGEESRVRSSPLVRAVHQDTEGRHWVTKVPVGQEDMAYMGIPVGPPDVSGLGLPEAVAIRLHEQLYQRGLLTRKDLRGRGKEVFAALQSAYRVDTAAVMSAYRDDV